MRLAARLSAFFLAALAVVLVGFSSALLASAWSYLHRQVEDRLNSGLAVLAAAAEVKPGAVEWEPQERELPLGRDAGPDRLRWMVFDDSGRPVDRSPNLEDAGPMPDWEPPPGSASLPARLRDNRGAPWRIKQRRVVPPATSEKSVDEAASPGHYPALVLTVAAPVGPVDATLAALGWSLAGLSVAVWLAAATLGRGLVRRALMPLAHMVESARALDATDPGWTIPEAGTGDELDELGHAFNELLARLHVAFERQRRFSADASHQLRTPLTALIGQLDVALRRERSAEEYRRVLGLVRGQAGNLERIVEALLFLGRAEADSALPGSETIDLSAWLDDHLSGNPRAGVIRLDRDGVGAPLLVRAHSALLGQVIENLLDNAAKYGEAGAPIVVRLADEGGMATLSVEDRGPGIAREELPRVFEPFFRSEQARRLGRPGVGLGLAIARRICAAMGGSIAVESEPGRGCRFTVTLPKASGATLISDVVPSGRSPAPPDPGAPRAELPHPPRAGDPSDSIPPASAGQLASDRR